MTVVKKVEIGKVTASATSWPDSGFETQVSLDWVESSSYMKSYDQEGSVDIEKDDAIALIDLLSEAFGLDDVSKLTPPKGE